MNDALEKSETATVRHLHRELCKLSQQLNDSFAKQIVLITIKSFFITLNSLYNLFSINETYDTLTLTIYVAQLVQTILTYGLLIYLINHYCDIVSSQVS